MSGNSESDSTPSARAQRRTTAHVAPFALFMVFLAIPDVLSSLGLDPSAKDAPWYIAHPTQWIYPLQTLICLAVLLVYRSEYELTRPVAWKSAVVLGIVGIVIWLLPGFVYRTLDLSPGWYRWLGFAPREEGFDPSLIRDSGLSWYYVAVAFRFARLALIVPLVEEIFWRGFLMRLIVDLDGDYWKVPFGTFHRKSLLIVTGVFVLVHQPVDYLGALIYGLLTYWLAVRSRSLSACVLMHAVANLLLGIYVMMTQQWGYW